MNGAVMDLMGFSIRNIEADVNVVERIVQKRKILHERWRDVIKILFWIQKIEKLKKRKRLMLNVSFIQTPLRRTLQN